MLRTYDRPHGLHGNLLPWPFFVDSDKTDSCFEHTFVPGDRVIHKTLAGRGMIVGINEEQMIVLWSIEPKIDFDNIISPLVKRVTSQLFDNQITQVQPMNLPPPGMIIYLDYT